MNRESGDLNNLERDIKDLDIKEICVREDVRRDKEILKSKYIYEDDYK